MLAGVKVLLVVVVVMMAYRISGESSGPQRGSGSSFISQGLVGRKKHSNWVI